MVHRVRTGRLGSYVSNFVASGTLQVVPINEQGQPVGAPYPAQVFEAYNSMLTNRRQSASATTVQVLLADPAQWFAEKLWAGERWKAYVSKESCGY
jgi:hypothetical protein